VLDATRIDVAFFHYSFVFGGEIIADYPNYSNFSEVARRKRKVSRGASKKIVCLPRRSYDIVERNRTNDKYAHDFVQLRSGEVRFTATFVKTALLCDPLRPWRLKLLPQSSNGLAGPQSSVLLNAPFQTYFPMINFNFSRVPGGILARSVRIACASAEPHLQDRGFGIAATASRTTLHAFSAFFVSTATI
jgi:hypothetical protein